MTKHGHHPEYPDTPLPKADHGKVPVLPDGAPKATRPEKSSKKNVKGTAPAAVPLPAAKVARNAPDLGLLLHRVRDRRNGPSLGTRLQRMAGPITAAAAYGWFDKQPVSPRAQEFEKAFKGEPTTEHHGGNDEHD